MLPHEFEIDQERCDQQDARSLSNSTLMGSAMD